MTEKQKDRRPKVNKEEILRRQSIERFLKYDQETIQIDFLGQTYTIYRKSGELMQGERFADLDEMASIYEFLTTATHQPNETKDWRSIASLCTNTTDTSL